MSLQVDTAGYIKIDGRNTGLKTGQRREGTIVYSPELPRRQSVVGDELVWLEKQAYQEHHMPHTRYSLAHDNPGSGAAGRAQFEVDIRDLLERLK